MDVPARSDGRMQSPFLARTLHDDRVLVLFDVELQYSQGLVVLVEQVTLVSPTDEDIGEFVAVHVLPLEVVEVLTCLNRDLDLGTRLAPC